MPTLPPLPIDLREELKRAQVRLLNLQADKIELSINLKKGELIESNQISQLWSNIVVGFKQKMLLIPKKISQLYDSIADEYELENILKEQINEALNELSRMTLEEIIRSDYTDEG